jgi:hypothetical protein
LDENENPGQPELGKPTSCGINRKMGDCQNPQTIMIEKKRQPPGPTRAFEQGDSLASQ